MIQKVENLIKKREERERERKEVIND